MLARMSVVTFFEFVSKPDACLLYHSDGTWKIVAAHCLKQEKLTNRVNMRRVRDQRSQVALWKQMGEPRRQSKPLAGPPTGTPLFEYLAKDRPINSSPIGRICFESRNLVAVE
ncbi:hypothetical protein Rhe02_61800 [Rhizocola hellebori]|uniref:Uncharacterized protein n=1 Tax=Rhizocola hellebori TaxID=1392758 RepID=A0A8J3VJL3_9ACTN|nr:hypothetical protein Rhe02_61800 [Rhizocola hellebori]